MTDIKVWLIIIVIAAVTALLRFLPFIIFNNKTKTPKLIEKLGRMLPYAVMGMLVVFCLKDMSFKSVEGFIPPIISCVVVALLHIWRRNTLLSIVGGTVCYMALVQFVF